MSWTELRLHAPAESHPLVATRGIAPFLGRRRGHFLPDPEAGCISVYVQGSPDEDVLLEPIRGLVSRVEVLPGRRATVHEVQMNGPAAQELVDDFLVDSSALVLALVERRDRLAVTFNLMVAQALALSPLFGAGLPYPLAAISYRSHVDGFFVMSRQPARTRKDFDERFERAAPQLRARLRGLEQGDVSPPAAAWVALLERYLGRIEHELRAGVLRLNEEGAGYLGDNFDLGASPFHQAIQGDPDLRARAAAHPAFNTMRVAAALLYVSLHRIGLRLVERYLLCHFTARAFETVHGIDPVEALGRLARALEERP